MMNKLMRLFLSSVLTLFSISSVYAGTSEDLAALLNTTQSMRANFRQTVYDNRGKVIQKSVGYMAMQRPGKFRWESTSPIPQVIIANQSRLWIYDPDLEQVTIRSLKNAGGEAPALLLSHVDNVLDKDYVVKEMQKKPAGSRWYSLIPRSADNMFASIEMGFVNDQIHEMRLEDHLGHVTAILFESPLMNTSLPASLFVFKAPKNVDVIDETHKR